MKIRFSSNLISGKISNGASIEAQIKYDVVQFNIAGTLEAVAEIGTQLAWMGSALRSSTHRTGLVYCVPFIHHLGIEFQLRDGSTTASCFIDFREEEPKYDKTDPCPGECWKGLFCNPVIVKGFPIKEKPVKETGVEIPLDMMAQLAGSRRIQDFCGSVFVKSFSTLLLLTKRVADVVIWHLVFNENGEYISYTDPRVQSIESPKSSSRGLHSLQSQRHILGWCSKVDNIAGELVRRRICTLVLK